MWFGCITSCTKNSSHRFHLNRWFVHNRSMNLGNLFEGVVHYLLIGGMTSLGRWDRFSMVSALMCMVIHWTRPTMSHELRLSSSHDLTKLLYSFELIFLKKKKRRKKEKVSFCFFKIGVASHEFHGASCIWFWSLGSQESNTSNGLQIRVEWGRYNHLKQDYAKGMLL